MRLQASLFRILSYLHEISLSFKIRRQPPYSTVFQPLQYTITLQITSGWGIHSSYSLCGRNRFCNVVFILKLAILWGRESCGILPQSFFVCGRTCLGIVHCVVLCMSAPRIELSLDSCKGGWWIYIGFVHCVICRISAMRIG